MSEDSIHSGNRRTLDLRETDDGLILILPSVCEHWQRFKDGKPAKDATVTANVELLARLRDAPGKLLSIDATRVESIATNAMDPLRVTLRGRHERGHARKTPCTFTARSHGVFRPCSVWDSFQSWIDERIVNDPSEPS